MSFNVSVAGFEGPFDLLLRLVMRQKVDVGSVSISEIASQYLQEVEHLSDLDLDVASDFVLVASTLLELKAASLVDITDVESRESDSDEGEDDENLTPEELRDVLVERLVVYRQFKSAAAALESRGESQARMHPRTAGPGPEFQDVVPDYLAYIPLVTIAQTCARLDGKRERFLLESEHIAAKRIPLETRVEQVDAIVRARDHLSFDELVSDDPSIGNRVVSLLALLELNKRDAIDLIQRELFGQIYIRRRVNASASLDQTDTTESSPKEVDMIRVDDHSQEGLA